jgi:NAD(P)-dependent dehydrogenase (short-subunit alcohol dehydrogenase family)
VNEAISKMQQSKSSLDVRFLKLDLQDLESVKKAAAEFLQKETRLDILINNAGVRCPSPA